MSIRKKRSIRKLTFMILPALLIAMMAMVPAFLMAEEPANALSNPEWNKVKGYLDSYIASQYQYDSVDGESGFLIDAATLKGRTDSNGDSVYLGEGDDAANAPILVDVLNGGGGGIIQGTAIVSNWNTTTANASTTSAIAGKVADHEEAGFSTDIVSYCMTGHTESVAAGAMGAIAQAGGYGGTTPPKVLDLKWGRFGWNSGGHPYGKTNTLAAPVASPGFEDPANGECTGWTPDSELVRCTAEQALTRIGSGFTAGNDTGYTGFQVIDIRPGSVGSNSVGDSVDTYQVPIDTVFNTGLNDIDPAGEEVLVANRTQHTAGIVGVGLEMLGFNSNFSKWGLAEYNNTIGEQFTGGAGYGLVPNVVDTTAPAVTSGPTVDNLTATSFDVSRTTNEPATSKIEVSDDGGSTWVEQKNDTILNAVKTTTVDGLSENTSYMARLKVCDGQANCSDYYDLGTVLTDVTPPSVENVLPTGSIFTDSTTITGDLSDSPAGVDTGSVSVTLDGSPLACTVTENDFSCPVSGLAVGHYTIGGSVDDNNGNTSPIGGAFDVVDNVAPTVTYTGPIATDTTGSPTVTGTYDDPSPSSGVNTDSVAISLDGTPVAPNPCNASGGNIDCALSGLTTGDYAVELTIEDNDGNVGSGGGTLHVDTDAPTITDHYPTGYQNQSTLTVGIDYTASAAVDNYLIKIDDVDCGAALDAYTLSCEASLGDGEHNVHAEVAVGSHKSEADWSFTVDTVAPVVTYDGPVGEINTEDAAITAYYTDDAPSSGFDENAAASVYLVNTDTGDSQTSTDCTATGGNVNCQVSGLTDGHYTADVSLEDKAGNSDTDTGAFDVSLVVIEDPQTPMGNLDGVVAGDPGKLDVGGWAIDPNVKSPIDVHIYVNNVPAAVVTAKDDRPDVGAAFPVYGAKHGFSASVNVQAASNTVCAYGIDEAGDPARSALLGCKTVTAPINPFGSLDGLSLNGPGGLNVNGWAIDPDTDNPIDVHVYMDGAPMAAVNANLDRPDVASVYTAYSQKHGYSSDLGGITPGPHTVCAYGINEGPGGNALLGCKVINVPVSPIGFLDSIQVESAGQLRVNGWTIDPDTQDPIDVHIYVNGVGAATDTADSDRPDVGDVYPGYNSNHGFSTLTAGNPGDTVCAYGINVGSGGNALLGCKVA